MFLNYAATLPSSAIGLANCRDLPIWRCPCPPWMPCGYGLMCLRGLVTAWHPLARGPPPPFSSIPPWELVPKHPQAQPHFPSGPPPWFRLPPFLSPSPILASSGRRLLASSRVPSAGQRGPGPGGWGETCYARITGKGPNVDPADVYGHGRASGQCRRRAAPYAPCPGSYEPYVRGGRSIPSSTREGLPSAC